MGRHEDLRKLLDEIKISEPSNFYEGSVFYCQAKAYKVLIETLKYLMDHLQPERSKREDLMNSIDKFPIAMRDFFYREINFKEQDIESFKMRCSELMSDHERDK